MWTPKIYTTTGLGLRENKKMAGVDHLLVYIQTAMFYSSLHIHQEMVYTSHFLILTRPETGGGIYFWGPFKTCIEN